MSMLFRTIKLRVSYWWRRMLRAVGVCPQCWSALNYTTRGRPICPSCGR